MGEQIGDQFGNGESIRKTKRIQLEIYEDHEASFYLALSHLKGTAQPNPQEVKLLLDSIYYSDLETNSTMEDLSNMKMSWEYIYRAGKYSEDYKNVCGNSFEEFFRSEFGQSIGNVLQHFKNVKDVSADGENVLVKTRIALLSQLFQSLNESITEPISGETTGITYHPMPAPLQKMKIEKTSNGIFRIMEVADLPQDTEIEIYYLEGNAVKKVSSIEDLNNREMDILYIKIDALTVIKVRQDDSFIYFSTLSDVFFSDETIDLTNCKETNFHQFPKTHLIEEPTILEDQVVIEAPSVDLRNGISIKSTISLNNEKPIGINKGLENIYRIPENVRKDLYLRQKTMTALFDEINRFFPDITPYAKSIIIGYFCLSLGIIDTEEVHDQTERTQTYHEYVGKTVRNTLKSKSFLS